VSGCARGPFLTTVGGSDITFPPRRKMLKWRTELEDRRGDQSVWSVRLAAFLSMLQLEVTVLVVAWRW